MRITFTISDIIAELIGFELSTIIGQTFKADVSQDGGKFSVLVDKDFDAIKAYKFASEMASKFDTLVGVNFESAEPSLVDLVKIKNTVGAPVPPEE